MNESRRRDAERHLLDPCRPEPTHLGPGVGRLGPPTPPSVFSTSCETVSHCFQSQPFQLSLQIQEPSPAPLAPRFSSSRNPISPTCPLLSDPRGKDSRGVGPRSSAPAQCRQTHHLLSRPRVAIATRACCRGPGRATRGSFLVGVTQPSV